MSDKLFFGRLQTTDYFLYILENDYFSVEISDFGATLVSFIYKPLKRNIVLNYSDVQQYFENIGEARGATVGRCANRIALGKYFIDGKEYSAPINNGPNSLHGGLKGFMMQKFKVLSHKKDELVLSYHSHNLEEGYPGDVDLNISYKLDDEGLWYVIEAISDQKTILNITNHSYFNLNNDPDIFNHQLFIDSHQFAPVDSNGLSMPIIKNVKGTAFDFTDMKLISEVFDAGDSDIVLAKGYDHNYLFEDHDCDLRAIFKGRDLQLTISSDLPDMHLYSGNYLKYPQSGLCFECQYFPNAINYQLFKKPIINKNEVVKHFIKYRLEEIR